jgi:hypothetical protein
MSVKETAGREGFGLGDEVGLGEGLGLGDGVREIDGVGLSRGSAGERCSTWPVNYQQFPQKQLWGAHKKSL